MPKRMTGNLFKNSKIALAFVGVTIFGVLLIIGTEDNPGSLHETVKLIDDNNRPGERARSEDRFRDGDERDERRRDEDEGPREFADEAGDESDRRSSGDEPRVVFASDDELIDQAKGFDPRPTNRFVRPDKRVAEQDQTKQFNDQDKGRSGRRTNENLLDDE